MKERLQLILFPFWVSQKLWWIIIIGSGLSLLIKIGMDYQLAKFHIQVTGTVLEGLEPYRLIKRSKYLIIIILFWTLISAIKEYIRTYKRYF
ncbi:hypothetical protein DT74_02965 [Acinetobacter sp. ETR1]|nr:hypothetical protein DT74_02965 [Acinetobacter sp. ETR1]